MAGVLETLRLQGLLSPTLVPISAGYPLLCMLKEVNDYYNTDIVCVQVWAWWVPATLGGSCVMTCKYSSLAVEYVPPATSTSSIQGLG